MERVEPTFRWPTAQAVGFERPLEYFRPRQEWHQDFAGLGRVP
jgi:hypothetical protein